MAIKKSELYSSLWASAYRVLVMKTKWGSCNTDSRSVNLNLELAKKPIECIEYVLAHEMIHLLERKHSDRFKSLMDKHLPKWKKIRAELNSLPVSI